MIKLTPKAILAAVGELMSEQQSQQRQVNAELRDQIAELQRRLEALEREPAKWPRAVNE